MNKITIVRSLVAVCCSTSLSALAASPDAAASWPQWGGPSRDFQISQAELAKKWPQSGPPRIWEREIGDGYSAIVSDGRRLYTLAANREQKGPQEFAHDGKETILCLDAATGETIWTHEYDDPWLEGMQMEFGPGPHSTPLLMDGRVYTVGCTADFKCLDAETGKVIWSHDLAKTMEATHLGRGYGASPLGYKGNVIIPIGGEGQGIVAFDAKTGDVKWKNQSFSSTYASPTIVDIHGQPQLISFTSAEVSGLDPADGTLLWSHEHKTQYGANISTPVWCADKGILFISSAYGMGARGLRLTRKGDKTEVEELWYNNKMKVHHGNAVTDGSRVYASSGDFGPAFFAGVDVETGEILWKKRGFSKANCVMIGRRIILLDEDGQLALTKVSSKKIRVRSKHQLLNRNAWTVPTLVGSTLYIRDRKTMMALDLSVLPVDDADKGKEATSTSGNS
ncbi:MAG: PQQ-binding-like beta-propeller repeat protein [Phycisphaerae bacterium]